MNPGGPSQPRIPSLQEQVDDLRNMFANFKEATNANNLNVEKTLEEQRQHLTALDTFTGMNQPRVNERVR